MFKSNILTLIALIPLLYAKTAHCMEDMPQALKDMCPESNGWMTTKHSCCQKLRTFFYCARALNTVPVEDAARNYCNHSDVNLNTSLPDNGHLNHYIITLGHEWNKSPAEIVDSIKQANDVLHSYRKRAQPSSSEKSFYLVH